jgi:hypothetical protein
VESESSPQEEDSEESKEEPASKRVKLNSGLEKSVVKKP